MVICRPLIGIYGKQFFGGVKFGWLGTDFVPVIVLSLCWMFEWEGAELD